MIIGIFVKTTGLSLIIVRLFIQNKPIYIQVTPKTQLNTTGNSENEGCFCRRVVLI